MALLFVLLVMGYGFRELLAPLPPQESLSVAAVQGNIPQNQKWDRAFEASIMEVYCRESTMALALHPDLIIWPEAATPRALLRDPSLLGQVRGLMAGGNTDFLIGSLHYEDQPQKDYNAAILLRSIPTEEGEDVEYYAKNHLVPFGEYIPFRKSFPLFAWIVGDRVLGDFDAGSAPKVLHLSHHEIKIAPLICFEDSLGDLARRFALLGAQGFITLTNDGWFGHTAASQQHVTNALFRCAETKLPMLRVANTGVTCLIDRFGRIINTLQDAHGSTFLEGMLATHWNLPQKTEPTFYSKHGELFAKSCLGMTLLSMLGFFWRNRKR